MSATGDAKGEAAATATANETTQAAIGANVPEVLDTNVTVGEKEDATARDPHSDEMSATATVGAATATTVGATIAVLPPAQGLAQALAPHPQTLRGRLLKLLSRIHLTKKNSRTWS